MGIIKKNIAMLVDGPINRDGRVIKIIKTLSLEHKVYVISLETSLPVTISFNSNVFLSTYSIKKNWIYRNIFFYKKYFNIINIAKKKNVDFDLIYCNDYPTLKIGVYLKKVFEGATLIYDSHEIYVETINQFFPSTGWKKFYGFILVYINKKIHLKEEKKLVNDVDYFITVCKSFKDYFEKVYNINNVIVLKNCPNLKTRFNKTNLIRDTLKIGNESTIYLYQGEINKGRGLDLIINVFKKLTLKEHFVILGDGPIKESLATKVGREKIKNVHFINAVPFDKLLDYTNSADVGMLLIQPINKSKELTLPNKIFEYMISGIPVISNSLIESKNIIEEGNCGYIIPNDTQSLSLYKLILEIKKNQTNLYLKGQNGKKMIFKEYNWESQVAELESLVL
jgi:glycosyltransferase involved in cell wall biosynthesis